MICPTSTKTLTDCDEVLTVNQVTDCDEVLTVNQATMDDINSCTSIDDKFKALGNACSSWEADTEAVNPKWVEHHQSGHLVKDKTCSICIEESGSRRQRSGGISSGH